MRLIDADKLKKQFDLKSTNPNYRVDNHNIWSIIKNAPTVEAISKADYESRLKAEKVAMLTELQLEIEKLEKPRCHNASHADGCVSKWRVEGTIQQKIDALKGEQE